VNKNAKLLILLDNDFDEEKACDSVSLADLSALAQKSWMLCPKKCKAYDGLTPPGSVKSPV